MPISELAIEAFIKESVSSPSSALSTIYFVADFNTGFFAYPPNVLDAEAMVNTARDVHQFLSNYIATFGLLLLENDISFQSFVETLGKAITPFKAGGEKHGGEEVFASQRWPDPNSTVEALACNPLAACVAILRINVEKLLLITKPLGEYKTSIEASKEQ